MVQPLWKSVWRFLRKLDMTLPEDPAIQLLGIYPEDSSACNKDICSTMFIAALFVVARSWKEPRCPSTEKWMQKKCGIFTQWTQCNSIGEYQNREVGRSRWKNRGREGVKRNKGQDNVSLIKARNFNVSQTF